MQEVKTQNIELRTQNFITLHIINTGMTQKDPALYNEVDESADGPEELYERMNITVDKGQEPLRLDKFLVARIEGASRNKVQQAIENGRVLINGKHVQSNHKIKPGEEIIVYSDKEIVGEEIIPEKIPLNIVYED